MKKFFPIYDIKAIDRRTTELQGIPYISLVERAAQAMCDWVLNHYTRRRIVILAGPGNNGADGVALGLLLNDKEWLVDIHTYTGFTGRRSECNEDIMRRLEMSDIQYDENNCQPDLTPGCLVVDALFGTGLKRDLDGPTAEVTRFVNSASVEVLSVDIPSGIGAEDSYLGVDERTVIRATHTITFQFPKLAFFLPELSAYIGRWHVTDIKLAPEAIAEAETFVFYSDEAEAAKLLRQRSRFAHKGTMGHAVLYAGSYGMAGAAVLSAKACLRSGVGLLTVVSPPCNMHVLQTAVPEAMVLAPMRTDYAFQPNDFDDTSNLFVERATAVGVGPGLGRTAVCTDMLRSLLVRYGGKVPMVIDADGLYALRTLLDEGLELPPDTILTPHPGELDRLTEKHSHTVDRIEAACLFAIRHRVIVILKGAFTMIALPCGRRIFNTTGNAGMATAGSGDVLTGIILSLLAQGYDPENAALLGVGLHATSGDIVAAERGQEALLSGDIAENVGKAYLHLASKQPQQSKK